MDQTFPQMQSIPLALLFYLVGQFPESSFYCVHSQLENPLPDAYVHLGSLALPLTQALIKEAKKGGKLTVKSLTYTEPLLCKP